MFTVKAFQKALVQKAQFKLIIYSRFPPKRFNLLV